MFCANTLCVSAAEKVDGIKPIEMVATDENDYFTPSSDGYVTVKKTGYYSVVLKTSWLSDSPFYIPITSPDSFDSEDTKEGTYSTLKEAVVYKEYSIGDTLFITTHGGTTGEYYLCYSEDGISTSKVFCVTPGEVIYMEPEDMTSSTPVFSGVTVDESGDVAKFSAELSVKDGNIRNVVVKMLSDDYYTELDTFNFDKSQVSFEYEFIQNGTFEVWCYSNSSQVTVQTVEIKCIDTSVTLDDPYTDSESPNLTIEFDTSKKGLKEGADLFAITVKSNEVCNICVGTMSKADTTEFTGYVYSNGVYTITATDSWGNTTTEEVKVTAFGDGSMPSVDDINNVVGLANENPLNDSNRNTYWASVSDDGSLLDEGSSVLPQTGSPVWFGLVIGGSAVLITGGAFAVKKTGILKKKGGIKK